MKTLAELKGEPLKPRDLLPQWECLAMLAEEAAELAHAALKLRRVLDDVNPTRINYTDAVERLNEEYADVLLSAAQLSVLDEKKILEFIERKKKRWVDHLLEHRRKEERGESELD